MFHYVFIYNINAMKLDKNSKYIAAVSGGPDSMALLHKYRKKIICVCHVDYHKRKDSNKDKKIVLDYCKCHHIKCEVLNVKSKDYKNTNNNNFQASARTIRYSFFAKCAKKYKCQNLLIAHNLNDFLETAIMQKNRKSLNFFYGIKSKSKINSLIIYRPLIEEFKCDLEKYCIKNKIPYAIDYTNSQNIYERNRIRKQLSKFSKIKLLKLYKTFILRNKKKKKEKQKVEKKLLIWKRSGYQLKTIRSNPIDPSVIYVYLKNHDITNVSKDKIKLIIDFINSSKQNVRIRLENGIELAKANGKLFILHNKTK